MASLTPTSSPLVELQRFSFWQLDIAYIAPLPILIMAPVWLCMLGWTANNVSTHHFMMFTLDASSVSGMSWVALRYLMTCASFL